ncbi:hypothetical protein K501DRAFT_331860 [Backusella circina FSU 941]|nr:hypothetical protein K501DRAFT_331860 [Backusella circina FSU 941]
MVNAEDNISMKDDIDTGMSSDDKEYEVEEIRDHSITKQGRKFVTAYLIKWVGYDDDENSWESEKNVYAKDMIKRYWDAKSDHDPDKALYYKTHKRKMPAKVKAAASQHRTILHVERKRIEREALPSTSSAKPTPEPKDTQRPINTFFSISKSTEQQQPPTTSRKGKERELPIVIAHNEEEDEEEEEEEEEDDHRKTRGSTKKPNYKDYYEEEDELMELDEDNISDPDEIVDDPDYNKHINDWQPLAQEVIYIGSEFPGAPLYCVLKWKNGKKSLHSCNVVKNKCPKLLLDAFIKEFTKAANAEPDLIVDD